MIFTPTSLQGSYIIEPEPRQDERGWFARYYCKEEYRQIGHNAEWVQMNHSFTAKAATIRGMHFQVQPYSEIKLLRCVAGAVYDVIIDIRKKSPTFLQWTGIELSANNKRMLYIPAGFAHGFQTLNDDTELIYHHSAFYQPEAEGGLRYNDPLLNIEWPLPVSIISKRDESHPLLNNNFTGI